jgi:hypothetical protein
MRSAIPYDALHEAPDMQTMIRELPDQKAVAIFWFASTLVEEVGKTDSNSMKQYNFFFLVRPARLIFIPEINSIK